MSRNGKKFIKILLLLVGLAGFGMIFFYVIVSPYIEKNYTTIEIDIKLQKAQVLKVVDGDTIKVKLNGKEEKVRLIGIDTPESVHPNKEKNTQAGKDASDFTRARLENKEIELEFDVKKRDLYGRFLSYIWLGEEMFNETLLDMGFANLDTVPPNVKYVDRFKAIAKATSSRKL
jgi:micrococcal nuclease